jgi:quinol monooxygenase YgiN
MRTLVGTSDLDQGLFPREIRAFPSVLIALGDIYAQIVHREEVSELMRATQEQVRKEPGCDMYAFAEMLENPGHFVVVQQWRDQAALDAHYRSEPFRSYQAGIAPYLVRESELLVHEVTSTVRPVDSSVIDTSHDD